MYAEIFINAPELFTYKIPRRFGNRLRIGQLVELPLGKRAIRGIVFNITPKRPPFKTKEIISIAKKNPLLTENQIKMAKWLSDYYFASIQQVMRNIKIEGLENITDKEKVLKPWPQKQDKEKSQEKCFILLGQKTENLHLKIITRFLKNKKQVIMLFADNFSLQDFLRKTKNKLRGINVSIISSSLKNKERLKEWLRIKNGQSRLILGTRTAIFSPFFNLGLIIIDKEYEDGFKQEGTPKYDTREVAEYLQKLTNCTLILQSDIPTLENFYRLNSGYKKIKSKEKGAEHKIKIISDEGKFSILTNELEGKIKTNIKNKKQVILFLNRKGKSTFIVCNDCGKSPKCPNCDIPLIASSNLLLCNHCGFKTEISLECGHCGSTVVKKLGLGTEKLEEEIRSLFPNAKIERYDETTKKTAARNKVEGADIIIGTQMIKNLSFNNVGLLIFLSVDNLLNLPTYKAGDNTQKTLASIINKAPKETDIFIKTRNPSNSLIKAVKKQDYSDFFNRELKNLKSLNYPPFYNIIQIMFSGQDEKKLVSEAERLKNNLKKFEVLGPFTPFIPQKSGKKRQMIIIKTKKNALFYDKILRSEKNISVTRNPENIL